MHHIDYDEVRRLRDEKMSAAKIAERLGCGKSTVAKVVRELGLPRLTNKTRRKPVDVPALFRVWADHSLTVAEVSRELGVTQCHLYHLADRHALPERPAQHRAFVLEEATPEEDAASGDSLALAPAVQARIRELGIGYR